MTVYENDEIDLRPYLQALIRKWWLLGILAFVGAAMGVLISQLPGERYESTAIVLLTKQTTKLSLTSQFPTTSEASDIRTRADTIIAIAESDAVAAQVMGLLTEQLPAELTFAGFKKSVSFETVGDTIWVQASARDATLAEKIANAWSLMMIEAVNVAYSGEQPLSLVETQRATAKTDYEAAQADLEAFLETSQIEALQQKLDELTVLYNGQTNDRLSLYEYYRTRKNEMIAIQIQGAVLKEQLQRGNQSAAGDMGDALATFWARATILNLLPDFQSNAKNSSSPQEKITSYQQEFTSFTRTSDPSLIFQINDPQALLDTSQNYLADIGALVELAQAEQIKAETALQTLSQAILSDENSTDLEDAFAKIRQVKSQLEREQALSTQLTNARDLAWTAYQALATKETEIRNAPKESNYVVLVSSAMPPAEPVSRNTVRNLVIGAAAGFFLSFLFIVAWVWWRSANIFDNPPEKSSTDSSPKTS